MEAEEVLRLALQQVQRPSHEPSTRQLSPLPKGSPPNNPKVILVLRRACSLKLGNPS